MMPEVRHAIDQFLDRSMMADFKYYDLMQTVSSSIRSQAATLLGGTAQNLALFPNSATAFSTLMMAYPFLDQDHVIVVENDFPSTSLSFTVLRKEKQLLVTVLAQAEFYKDPVGCLKAAITPKTRCFASSFVGYMSGFSIPLKEISELCQLKGVHFFCDATQGAGVLPIESTQLGLSAVVASSYKWLRAPVGVAIALLSEELQSLLHPVSAGWLSSNDPSEMVAVDAHFSNTAKSFESGGRPLMASIGLEAALTTLHAYGFSTIQEETAVLSRYLYRALNSRGYSIFYDSGEKTLSGIISIILTEKENGLFEYLLSKGYRVTQRFGLLRFSVYYFHSTHDVNCLLDEMERFYAR